MSACISVGPHSLSQVRSRYNQAIVSTWNEQLLLNLVRLRYRDTPFFLEVGSVASQYSMRQQLSVSPTLGWDGGASNVLGLGTGELTDSPTITYTPLQGQSFAQQLLSPIDLTTLVTLENSGWSIARIFECCVQRINSIKNAPSAAGPTPQQAPVFSKFRELTADLRTLQKAGVLEFGLIRSEKVPQALLSLSPTKNENQRNALQRVRKILGLAPTRSEYRISLGYLSNGHNADMALVPRSLLGVLFYFSHGLEIPFEDAQSGLVTITRNSDETFDWKQLFAEHFVIKSATSEPKGAFVKLLYRDKWFYIDDSDLETKTNFMLLTFLFYLKSGDISASVPMLTLGVGAG